MNQTWQMRTQGRVETRITSSQKVDFPLPGAPAKITKTGFPSAFNTLTHTQSHPKGFNFCDSFCARNGKGSRRKPLGAEASSTSIVCIFKFEPFSSNCCEFRSQAMETLCYVVCEFRGCVGLGSVQRILICTMQLKYIGY